jgi:uncharacterized protein YunC (DUF1805 family)
MFERKEIKVGDKAIEALVMTLLEKNLIVLRGSKGYVMCGYLNLEAAEKFNEVAIKITGVSSIEDALNTSVHSCSSAASKLGIRPGQPIKEVLPIIV